RGATWRSPSLRSPMGVVVGVRVLGGLRWPRSGLVSGEEEVLAESCELVGDFVEAGLPVVAGAYGGVSFGLSTSSAALEENGPRDQLDELAAGHRGLRVHRERECVVEG